MLDDVAVAAIVGAALCVVYAFVAARFDRTRRDKLVAEIVDKLPRGRGPADLAGDATAGEKTRPATARTSDVETEARIVETALGPPNDRVAALVVALLLLLLGASTAAVHDKVAKGSSGPDEAAVRPVEVSEKDLSSFSTVDEFHTGPLRANLCIVRFYARDESPAGKWWTTCTLADRRLTKVRDVRRILAVKHEWGTYDEKARYTIPSGTRLTYVRGSAADQCRAGLQRCLYRGGGVQYLFPEGLNPGGGFKRECANPSAEKATSRKAADDARYGPCH